jgi:uncharacterized protein (DUF362 family)
MAGRPTAPGHCCLATRSSTARHDVCVLWRRPVPTAYRPPSADELERALLEDVQQLLDRWGAAYADRPDLERQHLLLLALEREQIVAVAYREEAVADRVRALDVGDDVRDLIRQTLIWTWKDEQLHAEYLRGELLRTPGWFSTAVVYGRQVQGALSGWTSATSNLRDARAAPFRAGAAGALVVAAALTGQIPPVLRHELRYQTFHRYCQLNVGLEASAELAYRRLVELSDDPVERRTVDRIRQDEARHTEAFRLLATALTDEDRLTDRHAGTDLVARMAAISIWFVPAQYRATLATTTDTGPHPTDPTDPTDPTGPTDPTDPTAARTPITTRPRAFASRQRVAVGCGVRDSDKQAVLEDCLNRAGLGERAKGAQRAAIRASFMLGYDRRDRSNINDPEMVSLVADYLHRHGVGDVALLEAPTVYAHGYAHRSVSEVASYFGFDSPAYRIVDISGDLRPYAYERGIVQHAISGTWLDADLRIVMPKLRTAPTDFAHLSLCTLEGTTGSIDETVYAGRRVDYRSATMMLLDVAPPDFSVIDGWAPVADGPFGVMGCHRPAGVRLVYAGPDALSVDEVVLHDMGLEDARQSPIIRMAYYWFGLSPTTIPVDGSRPDLRHALRGAHASLPLRALGMMSDPVYVYLSSAGQLFVPAIDEISFPPLGPIGPVRRAVQWASQQAFGIRAPTAGSPTS